MPSVQPDAGTLEHGPGGRPARRRRRLQHAGAAYQRQVYNVCYRTLGNAEDAADATQDALLSAFRGIKTFNGPPTGLRGWLLRIAVNACYDQLRRRQRTPVRESGRAAALADADQEPSTRRTSRRSRPGPRATAASSAETARHIQQAIDQLPPEQRLTVVLCDVQGLSYDEAAAAMAVELGTVKSRLSRARAQLRDLLSEKGELPAGFGSVYKRGTRDAARAPRRRRRCCPR